MQHVPTYKKLRKKKVPPQKFYLSMKYNNYVYSEDSKRIALKTFKVGQI